MLVRKNIRMSKEVADWYEKKAVQLGVSQTNLMVMALAEYIKQDATVDVMSNLQTIMAQLENVQEETSIE